MGSSRIILLVHMVCFSSAFASGGSSTWTYAGAGKTGEKYWALMPDSSCAGSAQSPIDIVTSGTREIWLAPFDFTSYHSAKNVKLLNNGHALQVDIDVNTRSGHYDLTGGGLLGTFRASQFHFHFGSDGSRGSEHTVNGRRYPAEMHIVHYDTTYGSSAKAMNVPGGLAVLGFFLEEGNHNPDLDIILRHVGNVIQPDSSVELHGLTLANILPSTLSTGTYWRYEGSLTTPLCNEVVTWSVFEDTIEISRAQLNILRSLMSSAMDERGYQMPMADNYRSIQELNGRPVYSVVNDNSFYWISPDFEESYHQGHHARGRYEGGDDGKGRDEKGGYKHGRRPHHNDLGHGDRYEGGDDGKGHDGKGGYKRGRKIRHSE